MLRRELASWARCASPAATWVSLEGGSGGWGTARHVGAPCSGAGAGALQFQARRVLSYAKPLLTSTRQPLPASSVSQPPQWLVAGEEEEEGAEGEDDGPYATATAAAAEVTTVVSPTEPTKAPPPVVPSENAKAEALLELGQPPKRKRRGCSRTGSISSKEMAAATKRITAIMEKAKMEDPKCLEYPLHTYKDISPVIYRSVKAHTHLFDYASTREDQVMRRHFAERESFYKAEATGKSLYFCVVNLHDGGSDTSPTNTMKGSSRGGSAEKRKGPTTWVDRMAKAVLEGVKAIVRDYAQQLIEPFPGEVACDVSHYTDIAPHVAAAKENVAQFALDAKALVETGSIPKKGISGTPTPQRRLRPLSPEDVAKEIAGRISQEVLRPLAQRFSGADKDGAAPILGASSAAKLNSPDSFGGFRVCIGVAPTPALAKVGCDAEVLQVRRHPGAGAQRAPVRVRSFYQHVKTLRDSKGFMSHFRVAHVPVFSPAFVRFLQVVFQVDTCSQLYEKREELYFSLSKETFDVCYDTVFGRMRLPQESQVLLHCPANILKTIESLSVLSTNAIAIGNSTRTAIRGSFLSIHKAFLTSSHLHSIDARLNYGRLFTEEQFIALALRTVHKAVDRLQKKGFTTSGMRMDIRKGLDVQFVVSKSFPPTNNYDQLMAYGREAATVLAPRRQQRGREASGEYHCVLCTLTGLDVAVMVPTRLEAEMEDTKKAFLEARHLVSSSASGAHKSATKAAASRQRARRPGKNQGRLPKRLAKKVGQPTGRRKEVRARSKHVITV